MSHRQRLLNDSNKVYLSAHRSSGATGGFIAQEYGNDARIPPPVLDESEEESDIDDIAPNLALQVTATNLAAVLRLNSAIRHVDELLQIYMSFDNTYRDSK